MAPTLLCTWTRRTARCNHRARALPASTARAPVHDYRRGFWGHPREHVPGEDVGHALAGSGRGSGRGSGAASPASRQLLRPG